MNISVVICCFNSSQRIEATLLHLLNQTLSAENFEIIVVDNASTDNTADEARRVLNGKGLNYKIVAENNPGLMNARIKGIQVACGEIIVFVDDDNWINSNYLRSVIDIFNSDPGIHFCGGQSKLPDYISVPNNIVYSLRSYAVGQQYSKDKYLVNDETLWGAGIAIRRAALMAVFEKPFLCVGRKEGKQLAGDDTEICHRLLLAGGKGYYSNQLSLVHALEPDRLNEATLLKMTFGFGYSNYLLTYYLRQYRKKSLKLAFKNWIFSKLFLTNIYVKLMYLYSQISKEKIRAAYWAGYLSAISDNVGKK